jgi:hypothetical protein
LEYIWKCQKLFLPLGGIKGGKDSKVKQLNIFKGELIQKS